MFLHFSALLFCIEIILIAEVSPQSHVGAKREFSKMEIFNGSVPTY